MKYFRTTDLITGALAIVGALNWGLVGLFDFNLVHFLFGWARPIERMVYLTVGLCGGWFGYNLYKNQSTISEVGESIHDRNPMGVM